MSPNTMCAKWRNKRSLFSCYSFETATLRAPELLIARTAAFGSHEPGVAPDAWGMLSLHPRNAPQRRNAIYKILTRRWVRRSQWAYAPTLFARTAPAVAPPTHTTHARAHTRTHARPPPPHTHTHTHRKRERETLLGVPILWRNLRPRTSGSAPYAAWQTFCKVSIERLDWMPTLGHWLCQNFSRQATYST